MADEFYSAYGALLLREREKAAQQAQAQQAAQQRAAAARNRGLREIAIRTAEEAARDSLALAARLRTTSADGANTGPALRPLSEFGRRMHIEHVIDLAMEPPAVRIAWLKPGTLSTRLIGASLAMSFGARHAVAAPALVAMEDVAIVLHELGHRRTTAGPRLEREILAWVWARDHALVWDWTCHAAMATGLRSHVEAEEAKRQVFTVQAIERLVAPESFDQHKRLMTAAIAEAFEDRRFVAEHGSHPCACGQYCAAPEATATALDADGRMVCRPCRNALRTERLIAAQKLRRNRLRSKPR